MKYRGFEIEVVEEAGKIKLGKIKNGRLPVSLFSRGKRVQSIDVDIDGHISQFYERIERLETEARKGNRIIGFDGEISTSLVSDDQRVMGILKLKAPKSFWQDRKKRLSEDHARALYRSVVSIDSVVENGHFHVFRRDVTDALMAESLNFEPIHFKKVQDAFNSYCRRIDGFFLENAPLPEPLTVEDEATDNYDSLVKIKVVLSVNPEVVSDRSRLIQASRIWLRGRGEPKPKPKPTSVPMKPESKLGQQGMVTTAGEHEI